MFFDYFYSYYLSFKFIFTKKSYGGWGWGWDIDRVCDWVGVVVFEIDFCKYIYGEM